MFWSVKVSEIPRMLGCLRSPFFVSIEGRHDVFGALTGDHGYFVDFRKAGLIALDAVAANAHGVDGLAGFGIAFELLGLGR